MTNCEKCVREIDEEEVQMCDLCGMDGLGNCCIAQDEHDCTEEEYQGKSVLRKGSVKSSDHGRRRG